MRPSGYTDCVQVSEKLLFFAGTGIRDDEPVTVRGDLQRRAFRVTSRFWRIPKIIHMTFIPKLTERRI